MSIEALYGANINRAYRSYTEETIMNDENEHYESYPKDRLSGTTASDVVVKPVVAIPRAAVVREHPLRKFTLRGDAAKLEARAVETLPLLGEFVLQGQSTMIYAQPNAGKTLTVMRLILDAIEGERVDPDKLYCLNADDSSKGLAEKVKLLEEVGAHMLAPGYKGFRVSQFVDQMSAAVSDGSARGSVVIIDTVKKVTNLMDKARSSEFGQVCRACVMAGGTVVGLGHTAKSPNSDGTPRYQGTTDILEDFDAVYVAELMKAKASSNERIIRFTRLKSRADSPDVVAYAYSTKNGATYREKLASLRPVYPEELSGSALEDQLDDEEVVVDLRRVISTGHGNDGIEKLVRTAAQNGDISRATARRVLDQYTGTDPAIHHWHYHKGDRGKRTYYLIPRD